MYWNMYLCKNFFGNGNLVQIIVIFVLIVNLDLSCAYFDIEYPIVFSDQFSKSDSHFGYSVTLLKSTHPDSLNGWILVGAPKSNSTDPTYRSSGEEEPGAVWRCSLGRKNNNETCEILNLDPIPRNDRRQCSYSYNNCEDFPAHETKYTNWVGGTMTSIGDPSGKFVTCAPRWKRGKGTLMNGLCYFFKIADVTRYFDDSKDTLVNLSKYNHRLIPFFEKNGSNQNFVYDSQNQSVKWAYGQAGFSTHLSRQPNGIELLMGAPGVYVWAGAIIRYKDGNPDPGSYERKNRNGAKDFASFMIATRHFSFSPKNWHDYFGYSVTSGKFDSTEQILYVGGAPRGGYTLNGEVVIFKFPLESKKDEIYILQGKQIASYFGSVLLAVDFNGDGMDELFVAAPLYSREIGGNTRQGTIRSLNGFPEDLSSDKMSFESGNQGSGDQGCVFMYSGEKQLKGEVEPFRIFGDENQSSGARFGSAMTSLGDINGDRLNDIAIGAPFENGGLGAIYIFYGSKENRPQLIQKIIPENIIQPGFPAQAFQGFGSSFSAGEDIDSNGTPDLAVGCFTSNKAVLLRTRPVIEIIGDVKFTIATSSSNITVLPRGIRTFSIASGIRFANKLGQSQKTLGVVVTLIFDPKYNRFEITPRNSKNMRKTKNPGEWEYVDQILDNDIKYSILDAVLIKPHDDSDPNLPPFLVQQRVTFNDLNSDKPKGIRLYNIKGNNRVEIQRIPSFDDFCSNCVGKGESKQEFALILSNEECLVCVSKLKVDAWFRLSGKSDTSRINSFVIGSAKEVVLEIRVRNEGEIATKPILELSWNNMLVGLQIVPNACSSPIHRDTGYFVNCSLGEHLRNNRTQSMEIVFNMDDFFASKPEHFLEVKAEVLTDNGHYKAREDHISRELKLITDSKIKIFGSPLKRVVWNNKFRHTYEIFLDGPSPVEKVSLTFKIPVNKTVGNVQKQILRVTELEHETFHCVIKSGYYSQIGVTTEGSNIDETTGGGPIQQNEDYDEIDHEVEITKQSGRQKRDGESEPVRKFQSKNVKKLTKQNLERNMLDVSCSDKDKSIDCMEIHCTRINIRPGNILTVVFELIIVNENGSELLESLEKDSMLIESKGFATIESLQSKDDDTTQTLLETLIRSEVPVWIYIVAIIGGIIILAILTMVLNKFGFFKRDTKIQLEELKAARNESRKSLLMSNQSQDGMRQSIIHNDQEDLEG